MSLADKVAADNRGVYLNQDQFASWHTWNGVRFLCVTDEETALKRKNNNVIDISWDNNTRETALYVPKGQFPGRAVPNEHGIFDKRYMKILQVNEDMGMLTIILVAYEAKAVAMNEE